MKTKLFLIMLIAVALFSCQKEKSDPATEQDVTFTAIQLTPDVGLKSTADTILCKSDIPDYAAVLINGIWYYPALFTLDGMLYTQAIKLPVGAYSVTEFFLYKNVGGTTGYNLADGDIIVFATPLAGADFDEFITHHLPLTFTVEAFRKAQIEIEVLCFQDHQYTEFGFLWFHITEIVVREQCFFGDICFKHFNDYLLSHYALQPGGLKIDMPAIMMLKVYKNGVLLPPPYDSFTNDVAPNYGEGAPLCIVYPDNLSIAGEVFTVELYIMVMQGGTFPFVLFHTFTFTDDQMIPAGTDGVVDFVLGNCNLVTPDLLLPPWQNLPAFANVTTVNPGILEPYFDVTFNSFLPAGTYDIALGLCGGWCGDENTTALPYDNFLAEVRSSLYPATWPPVMPFSATDIAKINWLFNHLQDFGYDPNNLAPGAGWAIQHAIWNINRDDDWYPGMPTTMYNAANTHGNFVPLPGGWAAVILLRDDGVSRVVTSQLIFVMVDP